MQTQAVHAVLSDDAVEAPILREYAPGARCLVLASYKGATMRYLLDHGAQFVHGVEPQSWAYKECLASLADGDYDPRSYRVDPYALVSWDVAEKYDTDYISMALHGTDGARILSRHDPNAALEPAENIGRWIAGLNPPVFDLAVINCEGSEYYLLPYLAPLCSYALVQFHGERAVPMPIEQLYVYNRRLEIGKGWYLYT